LNHSIPSFAKKSYGRFTNTAQDKLELCTILFKLNFKSCVVVFVFYTVIKSITGLPKLFILGCYASIRYRVHWV